MKNKILYILLITIMFSVLPFAFSDKMQDRLTVLKIYDGDSILVELNSDEYKSKNQFRIRLIGIDCFEGTPSERAKYQAKTYKISLDEVVKNGNLARDILKQELKNKTITFDFKGIDKYSRALGVIYADNENINEKMLKTDYCMPYYPSK